MVIRNRIFDKAAELKNNRTLFLKKVSTHGGKLRNYF